MRVHAYARARAHTHRVMCAALCYFVAKSDVLLSLSKLPGCSFHPGLTFIKKSGQVQRDRNPAMAVEIGQLENRMFSAGPLPHLDALLPVAFTYNRKERPLKRVDRKCICFTVAKVFAHDR